MNLFTRLRGLFARQDPEFDVELQQHLQLLTERYIRQGMSPEEAAAAARRQFGNTSLLREDRRALQTIPAIEAFARDLAYAFRMLRKNPGFAASAVVTLALGIGANTAIFSVCNAILLKPLPYADPGRLVMLWEIPAKGMLPMSVAPANFVDWRNQNRTFSEMAAINPFFGAILAGERPARLSGATVSYNFFSVLGVRPALGRTFFAEEDQPDKNRVAILSHRTWQEHFGSAPDIVGKPVTLNDRSFTVIGVLPPDFQFGTRASEFQQRNQFDVFIPMALNLERLQRGTHPLRVVARLRPGVELPQAQADLDVIAANLSRLYPEDDKDRIILAVPFAEQITGNLRAALATLLGAVGLVLLIACANVANLLLSRAAARERELAVRAALGAGRWRLAQQLLTESVLLATLGGAAGLPLAISANAALSSRLPAELSRASAAGIDLRVLIFTAAISLVTGILFGLVPLFHAHRAGESLKQTARSFATAQSMLRNGLVVAQIGIAMVLLIGAAVTAKSLWALLHVEPGFRSEHILTARLSIPRARYSDIPRIAAFERDLLENIRSSPGVQSAGLASHIPLSGTDNGWAFFIEGRPPLDTGVYNFAKYRPVSPGYFETIGIPLKRGRDFTVSDSETASQVVVINESMARTYWRNEDPVGQRLHFGSAVWRTIIAVVGDVLHEGLDGDSKPEMYVPYTQAPQPDNGPTIVVRTTLDTATSAATLRSTISALDKTMPLDQIETMDQLVSASVAQPRFRTVILAAFSILALLMASIGIYGVMNYLVIQRTREFGIRLSIGATQRDVLRLVLSRASILIAAGLALGVLGSVFLIRLIATLLYKTTPLDPITFLAVAILLSAVALSASYIPARRATRVDPVVALRHE